MTAEDAAKGRRRARAQEGDEEPAKKAQKGRARAAAGGPRAAGEERPAAGEEEAAPGGGRARASARAAAGGAEGAGGGQGRGAAGERVEAEGGEELLDLAGTILSVAREEIGRREEALAQQADQGRYAIRRAQQHAGDEDGTVLAQAFERLEADEADRRQVLEAKTLVLDDLAHDLATLAARLKGALPRPGQGAEHGPA